ncbi:DUF7089 family protein [Halopenitus persicus]|uniref:DUF7089 family protein n=1 Tax=Halopenitus persicus TaxID=1048396 RepID=UPI000BBAC9CC|nr:hypothetical protein [Halopenitus persicus]
MFSRRELPADLETVRSTHAPDTPVLDADSDFETIPPAAAEDLGLFVDRLEPAGYPADWLPADAPAVLDRYRGSTFTVGAPGDGTVVWTAQTDPPTVICKRRAETTPEDFLAFLIARAFVEIGADVPEHFLPFFGDRYRDLDAAIRGPDVPGDLGPVDVYQIANALFDAWVGLRTREIFAGWAGEHDRLHDAWVDAGERLTDRLEALPSRMARGEMTFPDATEYACSAVRHDLDLPTPFAALDTATYADHGADYAVRWAEKTFEALETSESSGTSESS